MKITYLTAVFVILLCACGKDPCTPSIGLRLAFVSFTDAEADTVILTQFAKGTQFNQPMDSILIDTTVMRFFNRNDTLFPASLLSRTLMVSQYDYRVFVPALNKTYNISDIVEEQKELKRGFLSSTKESCINPIRSYVLNGQTITLSNFNEVAYLKK